jgi:hypothetical protein
MKRWERVAVQRGLAGRIHRIPRQRQEGEHGGVVDDGGARLPLQPFDQRRGHADRTQQVRRQDLLAHGIIHRPGRVVERHDAGIVDQHVQRRELRRQPVRDGLDTVGVGDVQLHPGHAGIGGGHLLQQRKAPARDDHLVAEPMEGLGQATSDTGGRAGDEDGVAGQLHGVAPRILWVQAVGAAMRWRAPAHPATARHARLGAACGG